MWNDWQLTRCFFHYSRIRKAADVQTRRSHDSPAPPRPHLSASVIGWAESSSLAIGCGTTMIRVTQFKHKINHTLKLYKIVPVSAVSMAQLLQVYNGSRPQWPLYKREKKYITYVKSRALIPMENEQKQRCNKISVIHTQQNLARHWLLKPNGWNTGIF